MKRHLLSIGIVCLILLGASPLKAQPYLIDPAKAAASKAAIEQGDSRLKELYERLLRDANKILQEPNPTVIDKGMMPPSGDKQDYISMARYWWPNPDTKDGLPYIRRDGESNPELKQFDRDRLGLFASRLRTLSGAWLLSHNPEYARKAVAMLRTWFLNKKTRMNPNATYAQMVPGRYNGLGRPEGVLDTYSLLAAVDAALILEQESYLSKKDMEALRGWFAEYVAWLKSSESGQGEFAAKNNHGVAFDVQAAIFALFAGDEAYARELVEGFAERRLEAQIEADGKQPRELKRTTGFGYSVFNLSHLLDMCFVARTMGIDLYDQADGAIDRAIGYLIPFLGNQAAFPYQQIKNWEKVEQDLANQLLRASQLKENATYRRLYEQFRSPEEQKQALFILLNEPQVE